VESGGVAISIIHGKEEQIVTALAKSGQYDVVIRGHTHIPEVKKVHSTLLINPGEACGYLTNTKTAILDTVSMEVNIIEL
jgi:putative phosphoesterase